MTSRPILFSAPMVRALLDHSGYEQTVEDAMRRALEVVHLAPEQPRDTTIEALRSENASLQQLAQAAAKEAVEAYTQLRRDYDRATLGEFTERPRKLLWHATYNAALSAVYVDPSQHVAPSARSPIVTMNELAACATVAAEIAHGPLNPVPHDHGLDSCPSCDAKGKP